MVAAQLSGEEAQQNLWTGSLINYPAKYVETGCNFSKSSWIRWIYKPLNSDLLELLLTGLLFHIFAFRQWLL